MGQAGVGERFTKRKTARLGHTVYKSKKRNYLRPWACFDKREIFAPRAESF